MKVCPTCKTTYEQAKKYCKACGTALVDERDLDPEVIAQREAAAKEKARRLRRALLIVGFFAVLLIGAGVAYLYGLYPYMNRGRICVSVEGVSARLKENKSESFDIIVNEISWRPQGAHVYCNMRSDSSLTTDYFRAGQYRLKIIEVLFWESTGEGETVMHVDTTIEVAFGRKTHEFKYKCVPGKPLAGVAAAKKGRLPEPLGYVSDFSGLVDRQTNARITAICRELDEKAGVQIRVARFNDIGGESIDDFTSQVFKKWMPAQKGIDNGILILDAVAQRQMRIEIGYGLESIIPDAMASRVRREVMTPLLAQGKFGEAYLAGVAALAEICMRDRGVTLQSLKSTQIPHVK